MNITTTCNFIQGSHDRHPIDLNKEVWCDGGSDPIDPGPTDGPAYEAVGAIPPFDHREWWTITAHDDAAAFLPKFQEYGSHDLRDIGRGMAELAGRTVGDEEATEIGIYFYLLGKLGRWTEALKRGDRPSDDTLLDGATYFNMARMNRVGGMH